ncbi:MAG: antitoxin [Bryobacterales bacterium]|nr:antitoxin [Bryobacterales bacterium]
MTSAYRCINLIVMRTTVTLDDDVYEAVLHLSRSSGERLGKVLSEMARRGMSAGRAPRGKSRRRFPQFEVPPGAAILAASRIQRAIDEDGLS